MAKIMIDCANPNDFQEVIKQAEKAVGNCTITYAKRDIELQDKGISSSTRESARIIAEETDESPDAVRMKINRGKKRLEQPVPPREELFNKDEMKRSYAYQFAVSAISQLNRIENNMPYAEESLIKVRRWANKKLREVRGK